VKRADERSAALIARVFKQVKAASWLRTSTLE
jgi:hypothetical protein